MRFRVALTAAVLLLATVGAQAVTSVALNTVVPYGSHTWLYEYDIQGPFAADFPGGHYPDGGSWSWKLTNFQGLDVSEHSLGDPGSTGGWVYTGGTGYQWAWSNSVVGNTVTFTFYAATNGTGTLTQRQNALDNYAWNNGSWVGGTPGTNGAFKVPSNVRPSGPTPWVMDNDGSGTTIGPSPEPASLVLLATSLIAGLGFKRSRRGRKGAKAA